MRAFMPGDHKVLDLSVDPRVGGAYRITWDTPNGVMTVGGVYREIVKNERIVCYLDVGRRRSVRSTRDAADPRVPSAGTKTELVLTHTNLRSEQSRDGHASGWSTIVDKLADLLERG